MTADAELRVGLPRRRVENTQVPLGPDFAIENNGYHELKAGGDWPCNHDPCDQATHAKWDSRALSVPLKMWATRNS